MFKKFLLVLAVFASVLAISACKPGEEPEPEPDTPPTLTGETSVEYVSGTDFDPVAGVTATDAEDGDITADIVVVSNNVDTLVGGVYTVELEVTDSDGNTVSMTRTVTVAIPLANYLSGVDLSKLGVEGKGAIFAALEDYLIGTVAGGVPLYRGATRVMYAERVQLFSPEYNGVLGFGTAFSQFSNDDSEVLMYGDVYGQAGEYTWRASYNTDPVNLNPWVVDDAATSDFIDLFSTSFYDFFFDASKTGYEILPTQASADPIAVGGEVVNGRTFAKVWQIPLRDDLTWTFHPDFDTSVLPAGYADLDASDWLWTWQTAMEESWFRARSGGGDFVSEGVKNAAEFIAGDISDFGQVGLRLAEGEDNVLEIEFTTDKSTFDIKYMFAGGSKQAINQELYDFVGGEGFYGTPDDPKNVASNGIYYFDQFTPGQILTFTKNEDYPLANQYNYTGYQYRFIDGSDAIFQEFLEGRLDSASVPSSRVTEFATDDRVKVAPQATTWRLMINGFGTTDARDAYIEEHPDFGLSETWVPEPILGYLEMKQALYYGFDRYYAAVDVAQTYLPAYDMYAGTYFLDAESGTSVRGTSFGAGILEKYGAESYGFFPDAAEDLFKDAVAQAIADGYYATEIAAATAEAPFLIPLELYYASSGNTGAQTMLAEVEAQYEANLFDDVNFVGVDIIVNDVAFPNNYYDHMMKAEMDLGVGGISGSLLDAPSFMDVFQDDNVSGFTLNWGIDTSTPNIAVTYEGLDGELVSEIWSFNALTAALNGKEYIKEGLVQTAWDNADDLIDAYLDMAGTALDSKADGADLAEYVLGDPLADIQEDEGFDALVAYTVVTAEGGNFLYVISEIDGDFEMYTSAALFTTAEDAIKDHSGYADYFIDATGPLTDAEVAANAYIAATFPTYLTVADVAAGEGSPAEFTEVWAVDWDGWSDAYVVLHIGDYYIGWSWL
jgi:ABC-type oligopeptide transport system substrate-binding subunit